MKLDNHTMFDAAAIPLMGPDGHLLTIIAKATFTFDARPCDDQIPIAYGDETFDDSTEVRYESDIVPFKPNTDIAMDASVYAPDQQPATAVNATVKVGPVEKTITVFGERRWNHAGVLSRNYVMTRAKPFTVHPLRYSDAFGGMDQGTGEYCNRNLSGKGFYSPKTKEKIVGVSLPCIEDPQHLIQSLKDHPKPVGFGFYSRAWQPRAAQAGTYDQEWRDNRSPLPPKDFKPGFYNGAHPELQANGYLKGDETVELTNLTKQGMERFKLPGFGIDCRVTKNQTPEPKQIAPAMNLDTVFLIPDQKRYTLVWRGVIPIDDPADAQSAQVDIHYRKPKKV